MCISVEGKVTFSVTVCCGIEADPVEVEIVVNCGVVEEAIELEEIG